MFNKIGFLSFLFVGMTVANRILEGQLIEIDEIGFMNSLSITHSQSIFGLFSIPMLNMDFFFTGIPRLVKWDYSYFGGNAALLQYLLYSITFALSFALFVIIVGMVSNFFARR